MPKQKLTEIKITFLTFTGNKAKVDHRTENVNARKASQSTASWILTWVMPALCDAIADYTGNAGDALEGFQKARIPYNCYLLEADEVRILAVAHDRKFSMALVLTDNLTMKVEVPL